MNNNLLRYGMLLLVCYISSLQTLGAQSATRLWQPTTEQAVQPVGQRDIIPQKYLLLQLDFAAMQQQLQTAPLEFTPAAQQPILVSLPLPNGTFEVFAVVESPIMESGLAAKYPNIKTYAGQGTIDRTATVRLDYTPRGFHAFIRSGSGAVFIDPYCRDNTRDYLVYYKKDYVNADKQSFVCHLDSKQGGQISGETNRNRAKAVVNPYLLDSQPIALPHGAAQQQQLSPQLRTYRAAIAATGEYTAFHGGTKALAMAAITTSLNRINEVYEIDFTVRMVLVNNNDAVVYTNSGTDPFTNDDPGALIDENQTTIDNVIGNGNYDIGHNFSTGGGGLAALGVPCITGNKASGVTGVGSPVGDPFDIDYVAHEMGHQFGGDHTFNGNNGSCGGNRVASSAYEPGSATTIMGYAGICGSDDLQNNSDPYFHARSLIQCIDYITNQNGDDCPTKTNTGNQAPTVNAGTDYVIPLNTPFILTGSATDPNSGDALTYCWEEYDLGAAGSPNSPSGNAPIFRSFDPLTVPVRYCPMLSDVVNGSATFGELLPSYARSMNFKLVVRDNHSGGGNVSSDQMSITVASSGPFHVTYPNATGITLTAGNPYTFTWNVNSTNTAPVSCANVDILLSTDGGFTYPTTLATAVPNTGSYNITLPLTLPATTTARIMIRGNGNIFYDISNNNFALQVPSSPTFTMAVSPGTQAVCSPTNGAFTVSTAAFAGFTGIINLSASIAPAGSGLVASFGDATLVPGTNTNLSISNTATAPSGSYTVTVTGTSGATVRTIVVNFNMANGASAIPNLSAPVAAATGIALQPTFGWYAAANAASYEIQVAANSSFASIIATATAITATNYTITETLNPNTTYYWRVRGVNGCGNGTYSATNSFTTLSPACNTVAATNVPVSISENGLNTVTSTLNVTQNVAITDVNVLNLQGTHTWINDLSISLTSPQGTTVSLLPQICNDENNFNINFDSQAADANYPCPPTDGGTYLPEGDLADFDGQNSQGTWTLTVNDNADQDGGSLNSWSLQICGAGSSSTQHLLQLKALLQGAYSSGGNMTNILRTNNLLPTSQPYNVAPIGYSGVQTVLASAIPTTATDWILVEIRSAADNSIVARRAGFLLNNGNIVDTDGTTTGVKFSGLSDNTPYLVVLRHRNHAPIMSAAQVVFYGQQASYNFTTAVTQAAGRNPQAVTTDGYAAMWAGDYIPNGVLSYTDHNRYATQVDNDNTYTVGDGNLDKIVDINDFNLYRSNASRLMMPLIRY